MRPFVYNSLPARVVFGSGTCTQVAQEVKGLSCQRALVLTDSSSHSIAVGERVKQHLGDLCAGMYTNATMHTPRHVTDDALKVVSELNVDCVVAVGGGSTIGLGKAIVLNHSGPAKIKQVVLPTTCERVACRADSRANGLVADAREGFGLSRGSSRRRVRSYSDYWPERN